jgi:hypothetical protein
MTRLSALSASLLALATFLVGIKRSKALLFALVLFFVISPLSLFSASQIPQTATLSKRTPVPKSVVAAAYGKLPLSFEANQGQTDRRVKFLSRGPGYGLFLTPTGAVLSLRAGTDRLGKKNSALPISRIQKPLLQKSAVLCMRLEHANSNAKISGLDELAGKSNYFIGKDPTKWRRNIPTFGKVKYQQVYPGVDLVYYGNQRQLKYDFVLQPGADPQQIELRFDGPSTCGSMRRAS